MSSRRPRILFLTSTNLASNPRCLKEVSLALELGYSVKVFAFDMSNWTRRVEPGIISRLVGMEYVSLQASRKPFFPWLVNSVKASMARVLLKFGSSSTLLVSIVNDKRSLVLLSALRRELPSCDFVVAHNPGAFYPAWWLSNKTGIPFAVDMEDFHPGEGNAPLVNKAVADLMRFVLPQCSYVSFASPLIKEASLPFCNGVSVMPVINNVFSASEFNTKVPVVMASEKMQLVWFSQHISFNRGLEDFLPFLLPFADRIEVTLIGNADALFVDEVLSHYSFIEVKEPMPQEALNAALTSYDIGLALESGKADENRQLCLTNKIWAYLQAGLFIWANDTLAQVAFAAAFPAHTAIVDIAGDKELVTAFIRDGIEQLPAIRQGKAVRMRINEEVSWEAEKHNLANVWMQTISS